MADKPIAVLNRNIDRNRLIEIIGKGGEEEQDGGELPPEASSRKDYERQDYSRTKHHQRCSNVIPMGTPPRKLILEISDANVVPATAIKQLATCGASIKDITYRRPSDILEHAYREQHLLNNLERPITTKSLYHKLQKTPHGIAYKTLLRDLHSLAARNIISCSSTRHTSGVILEWTINGRQHQ